MTAIVGLEHKGKVYIGGDSCGSDGNFTTVRADQKVFTRKVPDYSGHLDHTITMGFTTSFRMGQLLHYALKIPYLPKTTEQLDHWMATDFVNAVRTCLGDGGYRKKDSEREEGGTFLVGVMGHLYAVHDDFQIARSVDGYQAVGSGANLALGSLYTTGPQPAAKNPPSRCTEFADRPEDRVRVALQAAARFAAGVQAPFLVLSA